MDNLEQIRKTLVIKPELNYDEVETIINALAAQPYIKVAPIIGKLQLIVSDTIAEIKQKLSQQKEDK